MTVLCTLLLVTIVWVIYDLRIATLAAVVVAVLLVLLKAMRRQVFALWALPLAARIDSISKRIEAAAQQRSEGEN
jgi:MFS superfamily sulfate permease-like transporter